MTLALIVALPFMGALVPLLLARTGRTIMTIATAAVTALAFALLASLAPAAIETPVLWQAEWLPQVGLDVAFALDGFGLLFAGLILGIGFLILIYANFYLEKTDSLPRLLAMLMLFQGAMTGVVLSDNLLFLLIFWELTSLASFLLIGYWRERHEARAGARMALTVTGLGGLAMIAGMLLLSQAAGTSRISELASRVDAIQASPLYLPALLLILLGAFTKSAQVPFHFWLPNAMAAPTPVSAYLHSATMVKAGVFLLARLWPGLAGTEVWVTLVTTAGILTMLLGAAVALRQTDLKGILAYSTVSHLGMITLLLGLGTVPAATAAAFHILNHATFKAALFMCAGLVDHGAHTRDIRKLGGLAKTMPITATLATIAGLSMAGFPFFNGFLTKEMMLGEVWATGHGLLIAAAFAASALSVAYSIRLIWGTFFGAQSEASAHAHDPAPGAWLPPAVMVALAMIIGLLPAFAAGWIVDAAASAITATPVHAHLAIWHGFNAALALSFGAFILAALLLALPWRGPAVIEAASVFDRIVAATVCAARRITRLIQNGSLARTIGLMAATATATCFAAYITATFAPGTRAQLEPTVSATILWLLLTVATIALLLGHRDRFAALLFVSVVGLVCSVWFIMLSAPDLALTQISVEVVMVLLMLLALTRLPRFGEPSARGPVQIGKAAVAGICGLGVGLLAFVLMLRDRSLADVASLAEYYLAQSKPGGGGANVVNVILVDFRGFDTFGEISVLGIAGLTIAAVAATIRDSRVPLRNLPTPLMAAVTIRHLLPFATLVGVYIFLRGHNAPGGGFVAGLIIAIASLVGAFAERRSRIAPVMFIACGVLAAAITGLGPWLFGNPFLTSWHGHFHLPVVGDIELASAMGFDLGVFLTVVGATMLSITSIARFGRKEA